MSSKKISMISLLGILMMISGYSVQAISPQGGGKYNYENMWEKVDSLESRGKPQSAIGVVNRIYAQAKSENNQTQMIKALEYGIRLSARFEENYIIKGIEKIKKDMPAFTAPATQVLHSLLADLYTAYYNSNRYIILDRTTVEDYELSDPATWDQKRFTEAIFDELKLSLENPKLLQETPTDNYNVILKEPYSNNYFRPTLYDLLTHHALNFFKNDEFMASQPAIQFEIDNSQMLDLAEVFVKLKLEEVEAFSMKYHALKLYQDLIAFHLNDKDPGVLVDIDLHRLDFVIEHAVFDDKKKVLLHTLEQMETHYIGKKPVAEVYYYIAKQYNTSGDEYDPLLSADHKRDKLIAAQYCQNAIAEFPDSYGAKLCKNLLIEINRKVLMSEMKHCNIPGKSMLVSLGITNLSNVYIRVIPLNPADEKKRRRNYDSDQKLEQYRQIRPVKQWADEFPEEVNDHNGHRLEIAIPPLTEGYYGLLISDNPSFEKSKGIVNFNDFWVTNISYISNDKDNGDLQVYVLEREDGQQMKGVAVEAFEEVYNNSIRDYELVKSGDYTTDNNGGVVIPAVKGKSNRTILDFKTETDHYLSPDYFYISPKYDRPDKPRDITYFFTDRAIYRPGQTVYFKGIILEKTGDKYEIQKGKATTVTFYDVNGQKVSSLDLISNDYGSINGSFTAPIGQLTGNMHIQNESGSSYFSVEEYKRPKFEVVFDPVSGSYKLGEDVSVTGKAMAYSGAPIDHAIVKYRVERNVYFPYRYYWRGFQPNYGSVEIANGELETDESGAFNITFPAIPDRSSKFPNPVYSYKLSVDVTDISGETHSAEKSVSVGKKSLLIDLNIPDKLDSQGENEFVLKTTNLNGEEEPATVNIQISRLKSPNKVYIDRDWEQPDVQLIPKEDFITMFPNTPYGDEADKSKWEVLSNVFDKDINTGDDNKLSFENLNSWEQGAYKVEMKAEDAFGEEVSMIKIFTLYSSTSKKLPLMEAEWFIPIKASGEPGETASFIVGTSYDNARLLYEIKGKDGIIKHEWITLNNEQRKIEIPIKEKDRGNFMVSFAFVSHNKGYNFGQTITVPFTNKTLDISFASFRDKLLPGQQESWNIKIRSDKGDKVAAEMLAGMYDASLDAFRPHSWGLSLFSSSYFYNDWQVASAFGTNSGRVYQHNITGKSHPSRHYDYFDWKDKYGYGNYYPGVFSRDGEGGNMRGMVMAKESNAMMLDENVELSANTIEEDEVGYDKNLPPEPEASGEQNGPGEFSVRRNLEETAFFFPDLKTNADGDVIISFTVPESLTRWKMMGLAYTQELQVGSITKELVTQKDMMIVPNQPRFFREGDEIWFSAKVVNMSEKELSGEASLQLFDAISMKPVDASFGNNQPGESFTVSKGNSAQLYWKLNIPENAGPVMYRVIAESGNFSDGEEMVIPVLKNRMLVTETLPLPINGNETKTFRFEKLAQSTEASNTLSNYSYTLEFTSNPAWYAVQALPYLMEYPYECSEQIFNRVYSNGLASHIVNQNPKIKTIFENWMAETPEALLSNLEKNQDLKNALLEESPWVMQAKNESERKKRIALLFDLNKMERDMEMALNKLQQNQMSNGGWPWFAGGNDNRYITQYIIGGIGKMQHLGVLGQNQQLTDITRNALRYIDERMNEDYMKIKKKDEDYKTKKHIGRLQIQYIYARSFFLDDYFLLAKHKEAYLYFKEQAKKYWLDYDKYMQGMIALSLHRMGDKPLPTVILASIKEHALFDDEMGMYWRADAGYYWYEAPIETQALLIEAFDEVINDQKSVELMKTWLLKQKQTHDWETTKATADACYALLMRGANLIAEEGDVSITVGGELIDPDNIDGVEKEAGTGYFQHQWNGKEITPNMADISISKNNEGVAWGAVYWQYFEDLDKITPHASPLSIQKKLFLQTYTDEGPVLTPVNDGDVLKPGDRIVSRIEIRVDRNMEFVHMKDMRAAAFEPINVLSGYRWQGGMGYYESIRDASVNFFFSYLKKGIWVFEYPLNVTQKGIFSNGISSIQCMYAPEFASHSEGVKVTVE